MEYRDVEVLNAFKIYSYLAANGSCEKDEMRLYITDDKVRDLVNQFSSVVGCTVIPAGEYVYLVPTEPLSPFHVSNEEIKKEYLPSRAVNLDIYLMYVAIIVLFGGFYDSYQSTEATRNFLPMKEWLSSLNNHISSIKEIDKDELKKIEEDSEYNWVGIVEKWEAMDDLRENVKVQDARTVSRLSFLNTVKRFLENQGLITDIGNDEIELTEKAKTIVQKYYMEYEFNRGILDFMYQAEREGKERKNAVRIENKVH